MFSLLSAIRRHIHPFSILALVGLDLAWNIPDLAAVASGVGIIAWPVLSLIIFLLCAGCVALIQHSMSHDDWAPAILKGIVFGIIAALPFSVISTIGGFIWKVLELIFDPKKLKRIGMLAVLWREIEKKMKTFAVDHGFWKWVAEQRKKFPNRDFSDSSYTIIEFLREKGFISENLMKILDDLRKSRNEVFHNGTVDNIDAVIETAKKVIDEINALFQKGMKPAGA